MVKNMAALWASSRVAEKPYYVSSPPTAASSSSDLTTNELDTTRPLTSASSSSSLNNLTGTHEARKFFLALRPSTPSTASMTPAEPSEKELIKKQALFDERLIAQLSAVEWRAEQLAEPGLDQELLHPIRPLAIPRPSTPPSTSPDSSRPASPSVEAAPAVAATPVAPTRPIPDVPADADESKPKSSWLKFWRVDPKPFASPSIAVLADKSTIVLPSPPTDDEKYLYAQTRRIPLYAFGTFSFLSVSVGMWFFVKATKYYWWLGIFVAFIQIYLLCSYLVGYCGRDFNSEQHRQIVAEHSYTSDTGFPSVDIYLPCCKEPLEVLENTYKYVAKLDYPNFKVWVLDDGGLDTVKRLAGAYGFNYITRDNKPHLKKAGNLRYAFPRTTGDFFVIFDADFCPRHDFLSEMLPYTKWNPKIAIIQSPQFFHPCPEQTWVEQGASSTQEFFYRIVQVNRDRFGAAICVGSNALYRREALVEVGGTAEIGHSEDVHTGFYAVTRGWTLKYIPLALACGISPDTPPACFSQQMRWCSGSSTLLTNPDFWKSNLSLIQKLCYMSGMLFYTSAGMMIFVNHLPGPLLVWLSPHLVLWYNCFFAVPSVIYCTIIFRLWSRQKYNFNVNFVYTIQQYAYFMAIKDRIFNTTALWVPSGDNNAHVGAGQKKKAPNNKYRNMRILCAVWTWGTSGAMYAGVAYRIVQGYHWYHFLPIVLLDLLNIYTCHKFIFYSK
ncbi:hypothetical protein GALMADRAFT_270161 [Galerina marginata CBS 339.88]|uniref:Glycosyltransferase 2-like domain-containing protein n=1 Tax=Galerina marginata (strain CBS 339.88) TaxID=685588 RepID=A0A067T2T6_GALM3|nr:hypothetical protein GALMADRAFT_270161 [Galerina marginata CBS 339.88]